MKPKIIAAAIAAISLAACGQHSASVGAGANASTSSNQDSAVSKSKSVSAGESLAAHVRMPAFLLITRAIFGAGNIQRMGTAKRTMYYFVDPPKPGDSALDVDTFTIGFMAEQIIEAKSKPDWAAKKAEWPQALVEMAAAGATKDQLIAAQANDKYAAVIAACIGPAMGWDANPMDRSKAGKLNRYMAAIAASCDFSNDVYAKLAEDFSATTLRDPDDAVQKIGKALHGWPTANLASRWAADLAAHDHEHFTVDLTGAKGIHFQSGSQDFSNASEGFVVSNAGGVAWFGDTHISGKSVELALVSSVSTKVDKSKTANESIGSGAATTTGADLKNTYH